MKRLCTFLFISFSILQVSAQDLNYAKKAVFIILDGIPPDVLEKVNTPFLDEIAKTGGFTKAYVGGEIGADSESPTISAVGYNSLLTGTWANKHNVYGNSIKKPNYDYWNIFRITEDFNPELHTAIFSTWLDNRTKLIGEGLEEAGNIKLDYSFDGFELDTDRFPHDKGKRYIRDIDELVSTEAARYIAEKGPDLSWIYLEFTDDMGHQFGDSPEFEESIILADQQVGRIWSAVKKREAEFNEDWMIVITTDHGRTADGGHGHGGQSDRERATWIITNHDQLNPRFFEQPGIVDILPSILDFLEVEMKKEQAEKLDGSSFVIH